MKHSLHISKFLTKVLALFCAVCLFMLPSCAGGAGSSTELGQNNSSASIAEQSQSGASDTSVEQDASSAQSGSSSSDAQDASSAQYSSSASNLSVTEDGSYTSKDEVALYIHTYGKLPGNFISKTKAKKAGWNPDEGNLQEVCPGKSIGGSVFYNDDGKLPEANGRTWHECDINYEGGYRGAERIVFSNDGLVFYTADHYETFEQLY